MIVSTRIAASQNIFRQYAWHNFRAIRDLALVLDYTLRDYRRLSSFSMFLLCVELCIGGRDYKILILVLILDR